MPEVFMRFVGCKLDDCYTVGYGDEYQSFGIYPSRIKPFLFGEKGLRITSHPAKNRESPGLHDKMFVLHSALVRFVKGRCAPSEEGDEISAASGI